MITASEALQALKDGNNRVAAGYSRLGSGIDQNQRLRLTDGQNPLAVVIGCSDSRVPLEIIFDQGLGDLFVVRVAGNIINPSQVESAEYAVDQLGTPLVVVLGHEGCGAVTAAVEELRTDTPPLRLRLPTLMEALRPVVTPMLTDGVPAFSDDFLDRVVRAYVEHSVTKLREMSPLIAQREKSGDLLLLGADYGLATGEVVYL
ncbi:carbonic anhydrase [bacterium]|nr:carbonic anhydrase [bacterium]